MVAVCADRPIHRVGIALERRITASQAQPTPHIVRSRRFRRLTGRKANRARL